MISENPSEKLKDLRTILEKILELLFSKSPDNTPTYTCNIPLLDYAIYYEIVRKTK